MNLHQVVSVSPKIGVFGSDGDLSNARAEEFAYETGQLLAQRGAVLFTGGGQGVMKYASREASEYGGLVISVWPYREVEKANNHCSIMIPTGLGIVARGQVLAYSVDGGILIRGGLGTHQEALSMYWLRKPCVAIRTSGGTAEEVAGRVLDERNHPLILSADTPIEAVDILFRALESKALKV